MTVQVLSAAAAASRFADDVAVVTGAGFTHFRRVAETPFNMGFEAKL